MIIKTIKSGYRSTVIKESRGCGRVVMTSHTMPVLDMDSLRISKTRVFGCSQIAGKARGKPHPTDNIEVFNQQARHFRGYKSKIEQVKATIKSREVRATFYKITNIKTGQSITLNLQRYNALRLKFPRGITGYNVEIQSQLIQH